MNFQGGMNMMMMPGGYQTNSSASLYIGNLDPAVHEEQLFAHFAKYKPSHVKIVLDKATGKSRGFGYVNFYNMKDAENARANCQYDKIGRFNVRISIAGDKKLAPEANLFVKNLDPAVTEKELHNHFSSCGIVDTVKIGQDKSGASLGYGYVQFEKVEDAVRAATELEGSKLKEQNITIEQFKSKDSRASNNNNLYVKNLPKGASKDDIESTLTELFEKFGKIESLLVTLKDEKWSAFINYEDQASANQALENLNGKVTLDGADLPLYVNLNLNKDQNQDSSQGNPNLYIRNLKPEVKEEELVQALQVFGEIVGSSLKQKEFDGKKFGQAIINFKFAKDATDAQGSAKDKEAIRKLFHNEEPYIGFLMSKEKREQFKQTWTNKFPIQTINPYVNPYIHPTQMYQNMPMYYSSQYPYNSAMQQGYYDMNPQRYQNQMQIPYQPQQNWMGGQYFQQRPQMQMQNPQSQQYGQQQQSQGYQPRQYQQQQYQQQQYQQHQRNYNQKQGNYGNHGNQNQRYQGRQYQDQQQQQQRPMGRGDQNQYYNNKGQQSQGQGQGQYQRPRQNQLPNQKQQNEGDISSQRVEKESKSNSSLSQQTQLTVQTLKEKLDDFMKLDADRQRNILGDMLFPKVVGLSGPNHASKITGMLVDFEVLTIQEILEFLEDTEVLRERVKEAQELLEQEEGN